MAEVLENGVDQDVDNAQEGNDEQTGGVRTVKAKKVINGTAQNAEVDWNPGESLEDAVERYGEDVVFDLYIRAAVIKLQAQMRGRLEQGATAEAIASEFSDWRPDSERERTRDPRASILRDFNKLPDEDRQALIAQLKAELGLDSDEE